VIAGGTERGGPSDAILSFDPASGAVRQIGRLPAPLTHSSAVYLGGRVVVVGGKQQLVGGQTRSILAIDPATGSVQTVGRLPGPLSDAAVVLYRHRIIVAGGDNGNGPQTSILELTPGR
jgi:N-acetylneuraminic acid mutarotase